MSIQPKQTHLVRLTIYLTLMPLPSQDERDIHVAKCAGQWSAVEHFHGSGTGLETLWYLWLSVPGEDVGTQLLN